MNSALILFWLSVAFIGYVYVGYPLLLWLLTAFLRPPQEKRATVPTVSLLVAAYNEAEVIKAKIRNALALDYPTDRLEIVIASDGSSDRTSQIACAVMESEGRNRVRVLDFREHQGKIATLNQAVPQLHGDIIVFSDASSILASG